MGQVQWRLSVGISLVCCVSASIGLFTPAVASGAEQGEVAAKVADRPAMVLARPRAIDPFTGQVKGAKVRLRSQPDLNAPIVKELKASDLLLVKGEIEDFYAVAAPGGVKAYVFRPYVLDGVIEGSHVNVRLEPDVEAPVIAQLNSGDAVAGSICHVNPKWMEIEMPEAISFYVAKEYVHNIGKPSLIEQREERAQEVSHLLQSAYLTSQSELRKAFRNIDLNIATAGFRRLVEEYPDFPDEIAKAEALGEMVQELYLHKQLVYLEGKEIVESEAARPGQELAIADHLFRQMEETVEGQLSQERFHLGEEGEVITLGPPVEIPAGGLHNSVSNELELTDKMLAWETIESSLYHLWAIDHGDLPVRTFYDEQEVDAKSFVGIIERFGYYAENPPGDFVLKVDNRVRAYLYSTKVDLEEYVGCNVKVKGIERPNHSFAFPAYFVLSVE